MFHIWNLLKQWQENIRFGWMNTLGNVYKLYSKCLLFSEEPSRFTVFTWTYKCIASTLYTLQLKCAESIAINALLQLFHSLSMKKRLLHCNSTQKWEHWRTAKHWDEPQSFECHRSLFFAVYFRFSCRFLSNSCFVQLLVSILFVCTGLSRIQNLSIQTDKGKSFSTDENSRDRLFCSRKRVFFSLHRTTETFRTFM